MRRLKVALFWLVIAMITSSVSSQAASLQGKVVDADTDVGVACPAFIYSGGCGIGYEGILWPDNNGYFSMDNLPEGAEIYIKMMPGNAGITAYTTQFYDGALTCATATAVSLDDLPLEPEDVNDPESDDIFKVRLYPPTGGGTISGTVTSYGSPLVGLRVQAYTSPCSGYLSYGITYTDENGYYQLDHMPVGNIYMKACPTCTIGFDQTNQWWTGQAGNTAVCDQAVSIPVSDGSEHDNIDFSLTTGASITGTLLDEDDNPITDSIVVHAYKDDACNGSYARGTVSSNGVFTIDQLPIGTFFVRTDCNNRPADNFVETYYDGGAGDIACGEALAIEIVGSETVDGIDITVPIGGIIQGQILSDGETIGTTTVTPFFGVYPDGHWLSLSTQTNPDGTYLIKHLPEGDITVYAGTPAGFSNVWWSMDEPAGTGIGAEATHLEVFPDDLIENIDFALIFYGDMDKNLTVDGRDLYLLSNESAEVVSQRLSQFAAHFGSIDITTGQ